MDSRIYDCLDSVKRWVETNGSTIEQVVAHIRKGWDMGERMEECLNQEYDASRLRSPSLPSVKVWPVNSNNDSFTAEKIEEEKGKLEAELRRRRERSGIHCDHGDAAVEAASEDAPVVEPYSVFKKTEEVEIPRTTYRFPDRPPTEAIPRWRKVREPERGSRRSVGRLPASAADSLGVERHAPTHHAGRSDASRRHGILELHHELTCLGALRDRKPGKERVQLMRDSIGLLEEFSLSELQALLEYMLVNAPAQTSKTIIDVARAALSLNSSAIRHTIICLLHNRFRINELDAQWWPEQWYTNRQLTNGIDALISEGEMFNQTALELRLKERYPNKSKRPESVKNILLRYQRAGKIEAYRRGIYRGCGKEE